MNKPLLWCVALACMVPAVAAANLYVPPTCADCTLASPVPDATTTAALDDYGVSTSSHHAPYQYQTGDEITLCNTAYCVVYQRTSDARYLGRPAVRITPARDAQVCDKHSKLAS